MCVCVYNCDVEVCAEYKATLSPVRLFDGHTVRLCLNTGTLRVKETRGRVIDLDYENVQFKSSHRPSDMLVQALLCFSLLNKVG